MFEDRGMNGTAGFSRLGDVAAMQGAKNQWSPVPGPQVEPLTKVLNATVSRMQVIESVLNGCLYRLAMHPTAQLDGAQKEPVRELHAVEAAAELRALTERIQKLATDIDERL